MSSIPAISFQSVSKTYPCPRGSQHPPVQALDGISLDVASGEFFGLLGPNGAGKTTLITILAGLARASLGRVLVNGCDVQTDYARARRNLGVVPQELVFDPFFNVREALRFQSGYFGVAHNDDWIEEILHCLGLTDKANANSRSLSGGMKRRMLVALALVHKPPVIVLDEPTAGVDVELRQTLWQFIARLNQQGHTVLLTTHYLEEAEALCSRIAMLKTGRVVALDSTSALLSTAASNVLCFKVDADLPPDLAFNARVTGRAVQFAAPDALSVENYLAAVRQAGLVIHDIEIRRADLEDVFLNVMRQHGGPPTDEPRGPPSSPSSPSSPPKVAP